MSSVDDPSTLACSWTVVLGGITSRFSNLTLLMLVSLTPIRKPFASIFLPPIVIEYSPKSNKACI